MAVDANHVAAANAGLEIVPLGGALGAEVRGVDIARFRDERLQKVSSSTVKRDLVLLGHVFEVARKEWGIHFHNPVRDIKLPADGRPRDRRLQAGEETHLLEACKKARNPWLLAIVPLFVLGGVSFYLLSKSGPPIESQKPAKSYDEFNLSKAPPPADPFAGAKLPPPGSKLPPKESLGLSGFSPESDGIFKKDAKMRASAAREREAAFIKKYDPMIRKEQERLNRITGKYYKERAVVRKVDAAFGKLPRYMKLRAKYEKDRDPYSFVRGAVGLPEVRKLIRKCALDPDVWSAAMDMTLEAMAKKPPKPLYNEAQRFLTSDKQVKGFMGKFTKWMTPKVPEMMTQAIPPGADLGPIQNVIGDMTSGGGKSSKRKRNRR